MNKIVYFDGGYIDRSNFSVEGDIVKTGGLILVEGTHVDSRKKVHTFTKERLHTIANNTNALFENGTIIPLLDNHSKTTKDTLGSLESPVRLEIITEENLPNKRAKQLIGKLGLFVDEVVVKSSDAVEKVSKNILKTISPGIDLVTESIREISLTPQPAITGLSLYKSHNFSNFGTSSNALTFDDYDQEDTEIEQLENEYEELTEKLWDITKNIQMADEETLNGADPNELQMQAINDFIERFVTLIGMNQEQEDEEQYQDPRLMRQQGNNPNVAPQMRNSAMQGRFSNNNVPIAAFSMAEMEALNAAEFGYRQAVGGAIKALRNRGTTGQTLGQIGQKFGRKIVNATRGKVAGVGRLGKRIGQTVRGSGSGFKPASQNQLGRKLNAQQKFGVKSTNPGSTVGKKYTKKPTYY